MNEYDERRMVIVVLEPGVPEVHSPLRRALREVSASLATVCIEVAGHQRDLGDCPPNA